MKMHLLFIIILTQKLYRLKLKVQSSEGESNGEMRRCSRKSFIFDRLIQLTG